MQTLAYCVHRYSFGSGGNWLPFLIWKKNKNWNTIAYRRRIAYIDLWRGLVAYRNGNLKAVAVPPSDEQESKSTKSNDKNNEKSDRTSDVKTAVFAIKWNQVKALVA